MANFGLEQVEELKEKSERAGDARFKSLRSHACETSSFE